MVADLYPEGGARRDTGFSIFYMGINLGAFLGILLCGLIGEGHNFHWGFSLAGIGMVLGLIQYKLGAQRLGAAGLLRSADEPHVLQRRARNFYLTAAGMGAVVMIAAFLATSGAIVVTVRQLAEWLGSGIPILSGLFFLYLFTAGGLSKLEKRRLGVIVWLYLLAAVFFSGFEQAGSSMNIFARDLTDRVVLGWEMPASWLQNVNPVFIILLAPVFGWLWTWLARRNAHPSIPVKFALGLFGLAAGFFVISWGAANAGVDSRVSMSWLVVTYFLHTVGELCLSPVGLSSMTKLAPQGRVGQMMGIWFIAAALGNLLAGLVAGRLGELAPAPLFGNVAFIVGAAGLVAILVSPAVRRLMGDID